MSTLDTPGEPAGDQACSHGQAQEGTRPTARERLYLIQYLRRVAIAQPLSSAVGLLICAPRQVGRQGGTAAG